MFTFDVSKSINDELQKSLKEIAITFFEIINFSYKCKFFVKEPMNFQILLRKFILFPNYMFRTINYSDF